MLRSRQTILLLLIIVCATALTLDKRASTPYLFADEAVYLCMTKSLALDFDLKFEKMDLVRSFHDYHQGPLGIILKQNQNGNIFFAKPLLYPLFASIFYKIFALNGFLILNTIVWWGIIYLLYLHWGNSGKALLFSAGVIIFSAFSPYLFWIHPELLTAGFITLSLFLWHRYSQHEHDNKHIIVIGISLALAITIKPQSILFVGAVGMDFLLDKRFRSITLLTIILIAALVFTLSLNMLFTGSINPYSGERKLFYDDFPYASEQNSFQKTGQTWSSASASFNFSWEVFRADAMYTWIGRFSGILWYYFPGVAAIFLFLYCPGNRKHWLTLFSVLTILLTQIIFIPTNYHGGGGALGNRYFTFFYPALLMILPRAPSKRISLIVLAIAGFLSGPYWVQPFSASFSPNAHCQKGLYRWFPVEWTLTGSLPIFDPRFGRTSYDGFDGYIDLLDGETYGKENNGFWIKGNGNPEFVVDTPYEPSGFMFELSGIENHISGFFETPSGKTFFTLPPNAKQTVYVKVDECHKLIDIYGRNRFITIIRCQIQGGIIRYYSTDNADKRFLGVFIRPLNVENAAFNHSCSDHLEVSITKWKNILCILEDVPWIQKIF
ncbi:hypothetical protein JW979_00590 [bacterium]|nr:hypothetical protein [candidate division CSSED10-310 bacterium]